MTDQAPQLPAPAVTAVTTIAQHLATVAAGMLTTYGLIQKSQTVEFQDVAAAVVIGLAGYAWAQIQHMQHAKAVKAVVAQAKAAP